MKDISQYYSQRRKYIYVEFKLLFFFNLNLCLPNNANQPRTGGDADDDKLYEDQAEDVNDGFWFLGQIFHDYFVNEIFAPIQVTKMIIIWRKEINKNLLTVYRIPVRLKSLHENFVNPASLDENSREYEGGT